MTNPEIKQQAEIYLTNIKPTKVMLFDWLESKEFSAEDKGNIVLEVLKIR